MDKRKALRIATEYARLARDVVDFERAALFGSHAVGSAQEHSDIDVGLFVEDLRDSDDYFDLLKKLYGLTVEVDVHIEPHLFIRSEDRSGFVAEIESKSIPLGE